MSVTISKRFKTVDKQEKSEIITFLKLNEFDQFYKKTSSILSSIDF